MKEITKEEFEEKVSSLDGEFNFIGDKPTLVKIGTTWCGPCKRIAPVIAELAEDYAGRVNIFSVDGEDLPEVSGMFQVQSVPTLVYIDMDGKTYIKNGAYPKAVFENDFKQLFNI